ncbi:MAG: SO_0444 family Cu/Zn efflux transporter [Candidatus Omnitrophica bacterium]|nr:SO_0444 family Cu/Zn efflux transporter [Candidatus Omnitrophota bacterium]
MFIRFLTDTIHLFNEMSPYLLFGFLIAGILKILIPKERIYYHLSPSSFLSIFKATLIGVPLPLCSCSVIPVATHIKKQGASDGATVSFLISTPTTGVDSILATYSLLGWVFAIIRPVCAVFSGLFAGTIVNKFSNKKKIYESKNNYACNICEKEEIHTHSIYEKVKGTFRYGFVELVEDTGKWILLGIIIGGIISTFAPEDIISKYLGSQSYSYPLMLLIGIPLYVCATGSIPIAASLIAKGMSPGAGLIFLFTGPATNSATLMFVLGKLGKRNFFIYLLSIILWAVVFGLVIDYLWIFQSGGMIHIHQSKLLPPLLKIISSILLLTLILRTFHIKKKGRNMNTFSVPDMKCTHCEKTIKQAFSKEGIDIVVSLRKKSIYVPERIDAKKVAEIVEKTGYTLSSRKEKDV